MTFCVRFCLRVLGLPKETRPLRNFQGCERFLKTILESFAWLVWCAYCITKYFYHSPCQEAHQRPLGVVSWCLEQFLHTAVLTLGCPSKNESYFSISSNWVITVINANADVTLLEQRPEKIFRLWAGFEPMTSAMPVQCSPKWAIKAMWERSYAG